MSPAKQSVGGSRDTAHLLRHNDVTTCRRAENGRWHWGSGVAVSCNYCFSVGSCFNVFANSRGYGPYILRAFLTGSWLRRTLVFGARREAD